MKKTLLTINLLLTLVAVCKSITITELENLYLNGKFSDVITQGKAITPQTAAVKSYIGMAYTKLGNYSDTAAIKYLLSGINYPKNSKICEAFLGECYFFEGDTVQAKFYLDPCANYTPVTDTVEYARKLRRLFFKKDTTNKKWNIVTTDNIQFYFQRDTATSLNVTDMGTFASKRQTALESVNSYLGNIKLPHTIDYFVWNDTVQQEDITGEAIGWANPLQSRIHTDSKRPLGHELAHVVAYYAAKPVITNDFITEGIATFLDQSNTNWKASAKEVVQSVDYINVIDFWSQAFSYPNLLYPVSAAYIDMLARIGTRDQLLRLLKYQSRDSAISIYPNYVFWERWFENTLVTNYTLSPSDTILKTTKEGTVLSFSIHSNVNWQMSTDANWVTLSSTAGKGTVKINATVLENTDDLGRTAKIIISTPDSFKTEVKIVQSAYGTGTKTIGTQQPIVWFANGTLLADQLPEHATLKVVDMSGRVLKSISLSASSASLNLTGVAGGIYNIVIISPESSFVKRIIIQ